MTVKRDRVQRWFDWINVSDTVIPPWAVIAITGSRIVGTRIVFEAGRLSFNTSDSVLLWENGVPWNAAFNDHNGVEVGAEGKLTVDLPAWCLITESVNVMDFVTCNGGGTTQRFSLETYLGIDNGTPDPFRVYWPGFHVLATRLIPDFTTIWNAKPPRFLQGNFKIGFVGGLATDVLAFDQEQP